MSTIDHNRAVGPVAFLIDATNTARKAAEDALQYKREACMAAAEAGGVAACVHTTNRDNVFNGTARFNAPVEAGTVDAGYVSAERIEAASAAVEDCLTVAGKHVLLEGDIDVSWAASKDGNNVFTGTNAFTSDTTITGLSVYGYLNAGKAIRMGGTFQSTVVCNDLQVKEDGNLYWGNCKLNTGRCASEIGSCYVKRYEDNRFTGEDTFTKPVTIGEGGAAVKLEGIDGVLAVNGNQVVHDVMKNVSGPPLPQDEDWSAVDKLTATMIPMPYDQFGIVQPAGVVVRGKDGALIADNRSIRKLTIPGIKISDASKRIVICLAQVTRSNYADSGVQLPEYAIYLKSEVMQGGVGDVFHNVELYPTENVLTTMDMAELMPYFRGIRDPSISLVICTEDESTGVLYTGVRFGNFVAYPASSTYKPMYAGLLNIFAPENGNTLTPAIPDGYLDSLSGSHYLASSTAYGNTRYAQGTIPLNAIVDLGDKVNINSVNIGEYAPTLAGDNQLTGHNTFHDATVYRLGAGSCSHYDYNAGIYYSMPAVMMGDCGIRFVQDGLPSRLDQDYGTSHVLYRSGDDLMWNGKKIGSDSGSGYVRTTGSNIITADNTFSGTNTFNTRLLVNDDLRVTGNTVLCGCVKVGGIVSCGAISGCTLTATGAILLLGSRYSTTFACIQTNYCDGTVDLLMNGKKLLVEGGGGGGGDAVTRTGCNVITANNEFYGTNTFHGDVDVKGTGFNVSTGCGAITLKTRCGFGELDIAPCGLVKVKAERGLYLQTGTYNDPIALLTCSCRLYVNSRAGDGAGMIPVMADLWQEIRSDYGTFKSLGATSFSARRIDLGSYGGQVRLDVGTAGGLTVDGKKVLIDDGGSGGDFVTRTGSNTITADNMFSGTNTFRGDVFIDDYTGTRHLVEVTQDYFGTEFKLKGLTSVQGSCVLTLAGTFHLNLETEDTAGMINVIGPGFRGSTSFKKFAAFLNTL